MLRSLSLLAGAALLASPVAAKDYFVSAIRGSDTNAGSAAAPFQTLTKSMGQLLAGDRLFVLPGRYTPTLGEKFPIKIPDGVQVLGSDQRSCVIDAEFDVTLPDLKKNTVQGHMVFLGSKSTLSSIGIVNGPRNPAKPGDYWWSIALRIEDSSGNANQTVVDRVWVDRVSRGMFWGYAAGDHNIQGNVIRNSVVSRFYVEAVNGTPAKGTAGNNLLYNCTLMGHVDPVTKKPLGRANCSFNPGMAVDIRNCVIGGSDWGGIECDPAKTKITTDYNCFHSLGGGFQPLRGPTNLGKNDIVKDPLLATLPTMTLPIDPHHAGATSPLFQAGVLQTNQAAEKDWDGMIRVFGGKVDIGADEYSGADASFFGVPQNGQTLYMGGVGTPSSATVFLLGFGQMTSGVPIPGFQGQLWLDLTLPVLALPATNDANGSARLGLPLPQGKGMANIGLYLQGIDVGSLTFSDLDMTTTTN